MTPADALRDACFAARQYRYIPDTVTVDGLTVPTDVWDTSREFSQRGGGDCDGFSVFAIHHAAKMAPSEPYYFVVGEVLQRGEWRGHAWVELRQAETVLWCDPTWGELPQVPEKLGYPDRRRPLACWPYVGNGQFGPQESYVG